jgi:putative membrane protein
VDDINKLSGEPADITGFVYLDPRLPTNQIMVGRFTITCCVADAVALGIVVETTQAAILESNTWVRVKGKIQVIQDEEKLKPLLQAIEVETIPEPAQPYLFP